MPKYLCLQRVVPVEGGAGASPSPAEMQEMYSKFNEWRERFQANIVDLGGRLGDGRVALHSAVSDGPFVEVKELRRAPERHFVRSSAARPSALLACSPAIPSERPPIHLRCSP